MQILPFPLMMMFTSICPDKSGEILGKIPSIAVYPEYFDRIENYLNNIADYENIARS